jgi:hypothetical protein
MGYHHNYVASACWRFAVAIRFALAETLWSRERTAQSNTPTTLALSRYPGPTGVAFASLLVLVVIVADVAFVAIFEL